MNIDYAKSIKYIHENFDDMKFTREDLQKLNELLELIKIQVQQEIVTQVVMGDESVKQQIEEARKTLAERVAYLREQEARVQDELVYPDFQPREPEEGVAEALQGRTEAADKKRYDKEKSAWEKAKKPSIETELATLQGVIDSLDKSVQVLESPEEFIKSFLAVKLDLDRNSAMYQKLVDHCATTMASGYMEVESIDGAGSLFSRTSSSVCTGYTINPEALKKFLSVVRNPQMMEELLPFAEAHTDYVIAQSDLEKTQKRITYTKTKLESPSKIKSAYDDPEISGDIDKSIKEFVEKAKEGLKVQQEITKLELPAQNNFFIRIFQQARAKIFGNTAEDAKKKELQGQVALIRDELSKQYEAIKAKTELDERYAQAYSVYKGVARELAEKATLGDEMLQVTAGHRGFGELILLANRAKETPLHQFVDEKSGLTKTVTDLETALARDEQQIPGLEKSVQDGKAKAEEEFGKLSPEAKALHTVKEGQLPQPVGPIKYWKEKYIDISARTRYDATPFVSSLMLEALLNAGEIQTPEDAEKLGVEISPETIAEKRLEGEQLSEDIKKYTERMRTKQGKQLENKYRAQDEDDGERD